MATGFTVPSLSNILQDLSMRAYGMDPGMAGISQDPSKLGYGEIKGAGLSQPEYAEASQYGLLEDLYESPIGQISPALSTGIATLAPAVTAAASPIYDLGQAAHRAYQDPNLGLWQAIKQENIPQMWKGRTLGATKFLAEKLGLGNLFGQPKFREGMVESITPDNTEEAARKAAAAQAQQAAMRQAAAAQAAAAITGGAAGASAPTPIPAPQGGGGGGGGGQRPSRPSRPSSYAAVRRYGRADGGMVSLMDLLNRRT